MKQSKWKPYGPKRNREREAKEGKGKVSIFQRDFSLWQSRNVKSIQYARNQIMNGKWQDGAVKAPKRLNVISAQPFRSITLTGN